MNHELLKVALAEYGITEQQGQVHHPRVLQYFHDIGHRWVQNDETAWCSAFVNWVALQACYEYSGALNARSWLKVGTAVTQPEMGDVVVFWRESPQSWKGHVGFFIRATGEHIYVLGGNQLNAVNIRPYPAAHLLGYRRLQKQ